MVVGKGQFTCGEKSCNEKKSLRTWEVNFAYVEQGEKKNTLVKLRLCPSCSNKVNYHTKKREIKRLKRNKQTKSDSETWNTQQALVMYSNPCNKADQSTEILLNKSSKEKDSVPTGESLKQLEQNCWSKSKIILYNFGIKEN